MEPLRPGDPRRIGDYRLAARLGAGGMGLVYLGRSAAGIPVAVKVVHEHFAQDSGFRARFRREVEAARAVSGAFTAPVIDADPDAPTPWLVTAFLPGLSLQEAVVVHGPFSVPAIYALGAGLAEGLESIHRAGVVHRDLKPSNVLLSKDGPCIIDFGIARAAESNAITRAGRVVGSPGYMSPEQASGREVGPASDVFSLGAVLTFAATGGGPFGTGSAQVMVYRVVNAAPALDAVPDPYLRALIAECLHKDPARRPPPAHVLARLAPHAVAPLGTGWLPAPLASAIGDRATLPSASTGLTRRRLLIAGGAGGAVLAVGGAAALAAAGAGGDRGSTGPSPTPRAPSAPKGTVVWQHSTARGAARTPVVANGVVYVPDLEVEALDAATGRQLWRSSTQAVVDVVAADPAGDLVYAGGSNGILYALDAGSGEVRWSSPWGTRIDSAPVIAGGSVYVTGMDGSSVDEFKGIRLAALDARTGKVRWQRTSNGTAGYERSERQLDVLGQLAVAGGLVYMADGDLFAFAAATGQPRWRYPMRLAGPPAVAGETVFAMSYYDGVLHAVRAGTGARRWSFKSELTKVRPAVHGGAVYVGNVAHDLYAVEATSGRQRWRLTANDAFQTDIAASRGVVYAAARESSVYAVDAKTGRIRWHYPVAANYFSAPAAAQGVVYVSGRDKSVYALRGPAEIGSPTPTS